MSEFGNQYIPSVAAATGFQTAGILKYLADSRKNQMKLIQDFQSAQYTTTKGLAASQENTLNKQADAEEDQAQAMICQGGIGIGAPLLSTGFRIGRNFTSEFKGIQTESENLEAWRNTLASGRAPVMSAEDEPGIQMNVFKNGSPDEVNSEFPRLQTKTYGKTNPANDSDAEIVAALRTARGGSPDDQNPGALELKKMYDTIESKINKEDEGVQGRRSRYETFTNLCDQKIEGGINAIGSMVGGFQNLDAATARRAQAAATAEQQYNDYINKTQENVIQTATKVYDEMNQTQQQASQSYFEGLARANQPV